MIFHSGLVKHPAQLTVISLQTPWIFLWNLLSININISVDIDIDTQVRWLNRNSRSLFPPLNKFSAFRGSAVNPAGSQRETTQRIYVPINKNLGRGQRSKVMGLRCNDPTTAGHSLYRNIVLSAVWPLCSWPYPLLCCHHMERKVKDNFDKRLSCSNMFQNMLKYFFKPINTVLYTYTL